MRLRTPAGAYLLCDRGENYPRSPGHDDSLSPAVLALIFLYILLGATCVLYKLTHLSSAGRAKRSSICTVACLDVSCLLFHATCMKGYNIKDDNLGCLQ